MPVEFNGSEAYTLGVEEELHLVDAATGELVPKIEEIMSRLPEDLKEAVSYELFQSVLEIKTPPCATVAEAEKVLRGLRRRARLRRHPPLFSLQRPENYRARALQAGNKDSALDRPAGGDLRPARSCGRPLGRSGYRGPQPTLRAGPAPSGPLVQLPVLAGDRHLLRVHARQDLRVLPTRRSPPRLSRLRGVRELRGPHGRGGCNGRLHFLLVGRKAPLENRYHRATHSRLPDEPPLSRCADRPYPVPRRQGPLRKRARPLLPRARRREQVPRLPTRPRRDLL